MDWRGIGEIIDEANMRADGWVKGRRPVLRADQVVIARAILAAREQQDRERQEEAEMAADSYERVIDLFNDPRSRWLAEADAELAAAAIELAWTDEPSAATDAASFLARRRHAAKRAQAPAPRATCGQPDDLGYCCEAYHDLGCSSVQPDPVTAATFATRENADAAWRAATEYRAAARQRAARPLVDEAGRTFSDQYGNPYTMGHAMDEIAGHVIKRGYGPARPELRKAQRRHVIHRESDPGGLSGPGELVPADTEVMANGLREEISPTPESPQDKSLRRALAGVRYPAAARHWADAYDEAAL